VKIIHEFKGKNQRQLRKDNYPECRKRGAEHFKLPRA
jgi:hypothetical protein